MIEKVREQIRVSDVKDFGFSIIKMLAEFKNLMTRIGELGGTYDDDDKFLDFWECLRTMKEKEFARYVKQEKDIYRKKSRATRGRVEDYMRDMNNKGVALKSDNEWNIMSPEDAMVMALVNVLEKTTIQKKNNNSKKSKKTVNDKTLLSDEEKFKRKDAKIPTGRKYHQKREGLKLKLLKTRPTTGVQNAEIVKVCGHYMKSTQMTTSSIQLKRGERKEKGLIRH